MRRLLGAGWGAAVALLALTACHPAPSGFTLLFLGRSPAARVGSLSWAPDPDHSRLVGFDGVLHVVRIIADPRLATPMAVASLHGRLLVTERTGEAVVFDTAGKPVREWQSPFPASLYATGDDRIVAPRSPYLVQFVGEDGSQPLPCLLDTLGAEVSAATRLRLAVLDPASGRIVTTRALETPTTAIAVDRFGTIRVLDPDRLLAQTPTLGRDLFAPAFALPDLAGKPVRLDDYRGRVTLINFWASWCGPCRGEFPHMAELYNSFSRAQVGISAISDDVDPSKMLAFVTEFRPPFPILVGQGHMKANYHYPGLPYSVLLDKQGRIIERIFGFGGETEFQRLRETISREIHADSAAHR